jgi:hypothetical protein
MCIAIAPVAAKRNASVRIVIASSSVVGYNQTRFAHDRAQPEDDRKASRLHDGCDRQQQKGQAL